MLQLRNIRKSYCEPDGTPLPILDIREFTVGDGEQVVLVGRSGCGKTTLLHTIAGITRADSGQIVIDGIDIANKSESYVDRVRAAKIGYVFQTFNLLPGFTAFENVMLGMTFARGRKDPGRAAQLLDRVGLSHRLSHRPAALSVGEQQRVAVARAFACRPPILLADEPTGNLDSQTGRHVMDLVLALHRDYGTTLVLVTHDRAIATLMHRVIALRDGRIESDEILPKTDGLGERTS